jgi:hypothetical protein
MESTITNEEVDRQRKLVFGEQPGVNIVAPCKLNDGVIRHSSFERKKYELTFLRSHASVGYFIPASGSGSRMFQFLYDFLSDPSEETRSKTERFLNAIQDFAFFELLPFELKEKVRHYDIDLDQFVSYLLKEDGLGLGVMPKGLLPFHRSRSFILNAFQEQLLQGLRMREQDLSFHFTINPVFEDQIKRTLTSIQELTGRHVELSWSSQDPKTNAVAFDAEKLTVNDNQDNLLTRPSGHGALLTNLNQQQSDILFIKNIDNVQHESQADDTVEMMRYLGGLLETFKAQLKQAITSKDKAKLITQLNEEYHFFSNDIDFDTIDNTELEEMMNRPIRVCGMVRNEGQPGGGPFWVEENGVKTKQIVEKSQIDMKGDQYRLMVQSQYFNPVLMAASTKNIHGEKLDLHAFSDDSKYFVVDKKFEGKPIKFMERPGLWNGSMAKWLTIFVEVPSSTFTPVKTALDLLTPAHKDAET